MGISTDTTKYHFQKVTRIKVKEAYEEELAAQPGYKSMDVRIAVKLKEENKTFRVEKYEHSYPHCWRTDKPVLYYQLTPQTKKLLGDYLRRTK